MAKLPFDPEEILGYFNPITLSRLGWTTLRRGFGRLWRSPGPNSKFLIATSLIWSCIAALIDPYKSIYLSELGLSNLAIGGFFAMEQGLRAFGVLAGGLFAQRFGHKTTLLLFDFMSWVIPCALLALATEPWHVYVATVFSASNAMVGGTVVQLLVEDTPEERRTPMFVLFSLIWVLPMLILPALSGWMVERWGVVGVMRVLFASASFSTLCGILWRRQRMAESKAVTEGASLRELLGQALEGVEHLIKRPGFWPVLGIFVLINVQLNMNKAWYGPFVTRHLRLNEALVGQASSLGAIAFILVSLTWVPRIKVGGQPRLLALVCALFALPGLGLNWAHSAAVVLGLGVLGGPLGALHGPLLNEHLTPMLPKDREGLTYALMMAVMQVVVALSLALGGAVFETRFSAYPWVLGAGCAAMALMAWRLKPKL